MIGPTTTRPRHDSRPHVAVVGEELPYPTNSGYRLRTANLLKRLATRYRITLLAHRNEDPREIQPAVDHFESRGIHCRVVDRPPLVRRGIKFYARLAMNLVNRLPYQVCSHVTAEMQAAVRQLSDEDPVDLWQCEWTPFAQLFDDTRDITWVVMAHNVETLIWKRLAEAEGNAFKRWYMGRQRQKMDRFERRVFARSCGTICVSQADAALAREMGGRQAAIYVVENGVETEAIRPGSEPREPETVLFVGSLDYLPNQDAVRELLKTVFPAVRQQLPTAKLEIVGRYAPAWMRDQVARSAGVELHSNVETVLPYLQRATVMTVPLRSGGGSRLKILESAAAGLPCVSTRIGMEGLDLVPGQDLLVVDSNEEMASALIDAINDADKRQSLAAAARTAVEQKYDWNAVAEKLDAVWAGTIAAYSKGTVSSAAAQNLSPQAT